jgi:hypothetical protein
MARKKLYENLSQLGFPLMEVMDRFDVNKTLAEVVESQDMRLWEGFPVLLANAAHEYYYDYNEVLTNLKSNEDRKNLHSLLLLSLALYKHMKLSFPWTYKLTKELSKQDLEKVKKLRNYLAHGNSFQLVKKRFDSSRIKGTFLNYFEQNVKTTRQLKEKFEELSLEYALSQLFSPKQKELFKKKLMGENLNKTEREYYSRSVRKKVLALANPELHRLAQKVATNLN